MLKRLKRFLKNEVGLGTLEILLIVAALVIVAVIFRETLIGWVIDIIDSIQF